VTELRDRDAGQAVWSPQGRAAYIAAMVVWAIGWIWFASTLEGAAWFWSALTVPLWYPYQISAALFGPDVALWVMLGSVVVEWLGIGAAIWLGLTALIVYVGKRRRVPRRDVME
jgi:hypothetical protein